MKKVLSVKVIAIVLSVVVVVGGGGLLIANRATPKRTIKRFESAYNNAQIEEMVACFEPKVQAMYQGVSSAMNYFLGLTPTDMFNIALAVIPFAQAYGDADIGELPQMKIDVKDVEIDGDYATASVNLILTVDGERTEDSGELYLEKIDGEWYLLAK